MTGKCKDAEVSGRISAEKFLAEVVDAVCLALGAKQTEVKQGY